ncbi:MAG: hypothetical protein E6G65_00060 [Actinobacteria bacterium]|nr:MAG: hypothetical protein E6G65_00060 [Actinomycetota bacterium]
MSDTFDLILASYETLDVARQDFDELVTLVTNKRLERGHPAPMPTGPSGCQRTDEVLGFR